MPIKINVGNTWKDVPSPKINIGNSWKTINQIWVNVAGTWKPCLSSGSTPSTGTTPGTYHFNTGTLSFDYTYGCSGNSSAYYATIIVNLDGTDIFFVNLYDGNSGSDAGHFTYTMTNHTGTLTVTIGSDGVDGYATMTNLSFPILI
jgi:hypothetical protein